MSTSNVDNEERTREFTWHLLGEYSLSIFLPDSEKGDPIKDVLQSKAIDEWGLPGECVQNIERLLRKITDEVLASIKNGRMEFPGQIRIFCQELTVNQEIKGGWGYFVIGRSRESSSGDCLYDLYMYSEGE